MKRGVDTIGSDAAYLSCEVTGVVDGVGRAEAPNEVGAFTRASRRDDLRPFCGRELDRDSSGTPSGSADQGRFPADNATVSMDSYAAVPASPSAPATKGSKPEGVLVSPMPSGITT